MFETPLFYDKEAFALIKLTERKQGFGQVNIQLTKRLKNRNDHDKSIKFN